MHNFFLPRVLFKHLVVAKARLGIDVTSTMQRFKVNDMLLSIIVVVIIVIRYAVRVCGVFNGCN